MADYFFIFAAAAAHTAARITGITVSAAAVSILGLSPPSKSLTLLDASSDVPLELPSAAFEAVPELDSVVLELVVVDELSGLELELLDELDVLWG